MTRSTGNYELEASIDSADGAAWPSNATTPSKSSAMLSSWAESSPRVEFPRHALEAPELTLEEEFAPLGFPVILRTNSTEVLDLYRKSWGHFQRRYAGDPIRVDIHVVPSESLVCPPAPNFRMTFPSMQSIADCDNYSLHDLQNGYTQVVLSTAAMRHPLYASYFFIEPAAGCQICTRLATPLHAGCVEWNGCGILLCGESGAGKSTLSFACAQAGFGFLSDDASFMLRTSRKRAVTGSSFSVRLRPESAAFFPEVADMEITPRAAGKPSVEFPVPAGVRRLDQVCVDRIVFLNRTSEKHGLTAYPSSAARAFFQNMVFGLREQLQEHFEAIEHLLEAEIYELHYDDLSAAVEKLKSLANAGSEWR